MTESQMLARIKATMGAAIRVALVQNVSAIPEFFVGALAANESSGDPTVKRLEPGVFVALSEVLAARRPGYGSINQISLRPVLMKALTTDPMQSVTNKLLDLATSWGPTQIMGYQSIALGMQIADLVAVPSHFVACVQMLHDFQRQFKLDVPTQPDDPEWEPFFRCWNTGRPDGATTDPDYFAKGRSRMIAYAALP